MIPSLTRRGFLVGAGAAAAVGALAACSTQQPAPSMTASAGGGFPKTIKHALGETTLAAAPVRIAALDASYVDATLLLGAQLVAYTLYRANDVAFQPYLGDVSALIADAKNVGSLTEPDVEKILATKPDLIVSAKVRQGAMYAQLSKIAPTIMSVSTGPTWKQNIQLLGDALGKRELADTKLAEYREFARQVGAKILSKHPKATYSLVRFGADENARLYSSKSFFGEIMSDMGIKRPQGQPDSKETIFTPLAAENVRQADAQIVFESVVRAARSGDNKAEALQQRYHANPLWKRLTGKVVAVPDEIFVSSVSVQGARAAIATVAEAFGVTV